MKEGTREGGRGTERGERRGGGMRERERERERPAKFLSISKALKCLDMSYNAEFLVVKQCCVIPYSLLLNSVLKSKCYLTLCICALRVWGIKAAF